MKSILVFLTMIVVQMSSADIPAAKIQYVGSISIEACRDAKVLADWYARFGMETSEYQGTYYGQFDTAAGPFVFGIHSKTGDDPKICSGNVSVVYKVENFEASLQALKEKGITGILEPSPYGKFAHFRDPDGNKVSIWGD